MSKYKVREINGINQFPLPEELIDEWGTRIGPYGIAVYSTLAMHHHQGNSEPPTYEEIANMLNCSQRQVIRTINQLRGLSVPGLQDFGIPEQDRSGYIYLIKLLDYYKIGRSKNVSKRLTTMSVKLPFDLELLHAFPANDMYEAEFHLHLQFADKRGKGEWFRLNNLDVEYIASLVRYQDGKFTGKEATDE